MRKTNMRLASLALAVMMMVSVFGTSVLAAPQITQPQYYNIDNPYADVNWSTSGQYKAANHTHSTFSDGSNFRRDMLLDKYAKNFDIVAMTDHDTTTIAWDSWTAAGSWNNNWNNIGLSDDVLLTAQELSAINAGTYNKTNPSPGTYNGNRTNTNGMISMGESNETSAEGERFNGGGSNFQNHHINAFFATSLPGDVGQDRNNSSDFGRTMDEVIKEVAARGGITHFNHPGRYTGGQNNAARSSDPAIVGKYVGLFIENPSCVGMEIINKWDGESINDRILWDNILTQTMPQGRAVWGFTNDDSHSLSGNGHAWNVMLMPTLSQAGARNSMETGAFYGVSRIDRKHSVNSVGTPGAPAQTTTTDTMYNGGSDNALALSFLAQSATPSISNIAVSGNTITIAGSGFSKVVWYSGTENDASKVIATGNFIDVSLYADAIANGYVRAELVGNTGVAYTQPFGITKATVSNATPAASVKKLSGNQNDLTITVTEQYSNGMSNVITTTIKINNNAAGTYEVGGYKVYVDTKGNDQIRACNIVK
ncbi:MAG: hypothetical protein FWE76_02470 [Symbiobacteriaceae bacterium]|nr:hypothetical protein [Symbiobacteriaceae bacterium]